MGYVIRQAASGPPHPIRHSRRVGGYMSRGRDSRSQATIPRKSTVLCGVGGRRFFGRRLARAKLRSPGLTLPRPVPPKARIAHGCSLRAFLLPAFWRRAPKILAFRVPSEGPRWGGQFDDAVVYNRSRGESVGATLTRPWKPGDRGKHEKRKRPTNRE